MLRGIEGRRIFVDLDDYEAFAARLDRLIPELGFRCFAWALMPNHVHLAVQTRHVPLSRLMARLGTGYARYFNQRHRRSGHLFQNRFKSRLVEGDRDLLGLVLYIHRNPVAGGLVGNVAALGCFPWCGHGALVAEVPPRAFESVSATLLFFAGDPAEARRCVRRRMEAPPRGDEELGPPAEYVRREVPSARLVRREQGSLDALIAAVCEAHAISRDALGAGRRSRRAVAARAELSRRAIRELGLPSRAIAQALGVSDSTISRALASGEPATSMRR